VDQEGKALASAYLHTLQRTHWSLHCIKWKRPGWFIITQGYDYISTEMQDTWSLKSQQFSH